MKTLIVPKKYNNKKIVPFLIDSFPNLSLNTIHKILRKKDILVNGKRIHENVSIFEEDKITIYISDELLYSKPNFDILYEDDNILVLNKHFNIEVTGSNSLTDYLKKNYQFIEPCHRLDRNTSGIVLFAKTKSSLDILLDKFKKRELDKFYQCLVYGIPSFSDTTLEAYLFKDKKKSEVYISDSFKKGYQKIITSFRVLNKYPKKNVSLLEVKLGTGKTHQIRAHLAHIGYPILGDGKYGKNDINKKFNLKFQCLCAYKIVFHFTTDAGILNYLNKKQIEIPVNFPNRLLIN